ncbi:tryptophanyl-tRNA synthetase, mitochondrial [Oratosquilla oratoria]|uniref:tryptophanyl-tRNA synthetase, mitochondrial n=1 Tax=Oratosquilla oratoria TaxID=337810 RepID=UPI003F7632CA
MLRFVTCCVRRLGLPFRAGCWVDHEFTGVLQPRTIGKLRLSSSATTRGGVPENKKSGKTRRIFSGIQPTGVLHLGNYFGAIRKWVELQELGENVVYCVVDLHSITLPQDPQTLYRQTLSMAASLLACGIDPAKAVVFQQSRVPEHSQLSWVLGCNTTLARLAHLPQFKEKSVTLKEVPLGLYVYPVLQAADILLYKATHVPVGKDQLQHIQLAADIAKTFNHRFGHTFEPPKSLILDDPTSRLKSLRQPSKKMSKSEKDPRSRIELTDPPDIVREKLKKAVTDMTSEVYFDPEARPGVSNLMSIQRAITGQSFEEIQQECVGLDTGQYKLHLADIVIDHLEPRRRLLQELLADRTHLEKLLDKGAERARQMAAATWAEVAVKMGLSGL